VQQQVQETALALAQKAAQHMSERGIENARLDAELMLSDVLKVSRLDLYLQHDRPIDPPQLEQFRSHVRRRLKREPLQYILGRVSFRKLELFVDRRVLIPRPETEVLVDHIIRWIGRNAGSRVLDIGTGSGAIALSLARETDALIVATDVSGEALQVAQDNARRLELADRIDFRPGALFGPIARDDVFDVVVSNPPYVADGARDGLMPEVREWEPAQALFAGPDGMSVIEALIGGAPQCLRAGGLFALEIGADQAAMVKQALERSESFRNIEIFKDLAGRDRIVLAENIER
jgi:release factor glutamine methyltransferase